jgi:CRP-like cAMP-binding protein
MKNLLTYIHSQTDFSEKSWEILLPALTHTTIKKGEYLLKEGQICHSLFFIDTGYCRSFYDKNGLEKNTAFFFENEIATNINSFAREEKSEYAIQACEDLTVVVFDKKKLYEAAKQDPAIETLGRKCLQQIAVKQEKHAAMYKLMTAQERYEYFENNAPEILQRISLTQLSTYLGITRETLSRIRSRRQ